MTTGRRKRFLFVDDDSGFLNGIKDLFAALSRDSWEIFTAENHAQALTIMDEKPMDVVVLDISLPFMDGIQFLKLLGRLHPGQQVAMLTGRASTENRKICLENGATLFLEKPVAQGGFDAIFAELDKLAGTTPQAGFRGMMRRVGLQDVLQMECLGRKSSVLEVFTAKSRGRIFIEDGSIIHAESDALQGEVALYNLLALRGGEFNLLQFEEPPRRTISGQWEFLLMEAARLVDEQAATPPTGNEETAAPAVPEPQQAIPQEIFRQQVAAPTPAGDPTPDRKCEPVAPRAETAPKDEARPRIQEIVLCSGAGEVLYEWECKSLEQRLEMLQQIEQLARQISSSTPVGRFERLQLRIPEGRIVCEIQPQRRLFVQVSGDGAHSS